MTPAPWFSDSASAAIALVGNHLWQSTVFAVAAGLLTLVLRGNQAKVRYGLWLIASIKFLVPLAAMVALVDHFGWRSPVPMAAQPQLVSAIDAVSQPFSQPPLLDSGWPSVPSSAVGAVLPRVLLATWFVGCAALLLTWAVRWRRVATAVREGAVAIDGRALVTLRRLETVAGIGKPMALVSSAASFEPAVFGILRPVLLWPHRIGERLGDEQMAAVLAHEVSHVRRRDNLAAAMHMLVEALFWFHPLVWWVGTRLVEERERACDEEVIRLGSDPQIYAEGILRTCEFCVESPLACAAGVTGSDLEKRIERIMVQPVGQRLDLGRRLLLWGAGMAAAMLAIGFSFAHPSTGEAQPRQVSPAETTNKADSPAFEVASVKPNRSGDLRSQIRMNPGGRLTVTNDTLRNLVRNAYGLQDVQIVGGPAWFNQSRFDIVAKGSPDASREQILLMLRTLLTDRFQLVVHQERRELPVYALVKARNDGTLGPRFGPSSDAGCVDPRSAPPAGAPGAAESFPCGGVRFGFGRLTARQVPLPQLAAGFSPWVGRVVVDQTGLTGNFDLDLEWTPDQLPQGPPPGAPPMLPIDPNGPSIFTALQEQLGLKLEPRSGPVEVLVIDSANQPTEN